LKDCAGVIADLSILELVAPLPAKWTSGKIGALCDKIGFRGA
jgi:hypothetical protein